MRLKRSRIQRLTPRLVLIHAALFAWSATPRSMADPAAPDCEARWSVHGVALGASMESAGARMEQLGARPRDSDNPATRQIWLVRGDGPAERIVVEADAGGEAVGTLLHVAVKPDGKAAGLLQTFEDRWGSPKVSRYIVAGDRPGSMTEASVWIDEACDVKATLLVVQERTPRGFDTKRMGVRLERPVDPLAHLPALRDVVLDPPDR